jgi:hypothetical protein
VRGRITQKVDCRVIAGTPKEIEDALRQLHGSLLLTGSVDKEPERRESLAVDPLGNEDRLHLRNQREHLTGALFFEKEPGRRQASAST